MEMIDLHGACLREALVKLLGAPGEGTMAYVRSLPRDVMRWLCGEGGLEVPNWEVYFVGRESSPERRLITADEAVDIRENKRGAVLLFVDVKSAGAGMDGIYSAVRELTEGALLPRATAAAAKMLPPGVKDFTATALQQAKRLGRANAISPWREFDFFVRCAANPASVGRYIALLGLWPIEVTDKPRREDLAVSAQIVERLLLPSSAAVTAQARVESLLLPPEDVDSAAQLEKFLREKSTLRWSEVVILAADISAFRFNNLKPGFLSQEVVRIDLLPWRSGPKVKPYAWSGLKPGDEGDGSGVPQFLIDPGTKLEVRWRVQPPGLKAGSVEYKVSIVTGSDTELASRQVTHSGKEKEKCVFSYEDFSELDEEGKWEAKVRVHPVGEDPPGDDSESGEHPRWRESEEFILTFGTADTKPREGTGKKTRALVEEAIKLSAEEFSHACEGEAAEDAQGFVGYRAAGKSGRVYRPPLIRVVEEAWKEQNYKPGRWRIRVRADGSPSGPPEFIPLSADSLEPDALRKLEDVTRQAAQRASVRCGFVGVIYHSNEAATASYVNAWAAAIDAGPPQIALANTIEVQTLSGATAGLIVLPSHPVRVAWHSAYDELVYYARYEEGLKPAEAVDSLNALDGSYVPAFLPGIRPGESFVFGDTLGFYATAMIRHDEPEPQATIAQMVRCLASTGESVAPSVGATTAQAVAREVAKYSQLHPQYGNLHLNVMRPGDGQTVAQALGLALKAIEGADGAQETGREESAGRSVGFTLFLHAGAGSTNPGLVGRFLSETAERRRSGVVSAAVQENLWMLETYEAGGVALPRLKWAKRASPEPDSPAHLSVAFDIFDSTVSARGGALAAETRPLVAFGLVPSVIRRFEFEPVPTWRMTLAAQTEGDKHPMARSLSERLQRVHNALVRATAANAAGADGIVGGDAPWAVLETRMDAGQVESVRRLHELSDWVLTVDRNAGVEYFDAPREAAGVYEAYVIDCVPERQDLNSVQLVTSTTRVEEVLELLELSLLDMALSCSPRNARFLLGHLKALSGRLTMRLAERGQGRTEMIGLAMFHAYCAAASDDDRRWLSPRKGFFVPLDDVRDLLAGERKVKSASGDDKEENSMLRADLLYVDLSRKGGLQFTFVELKYRRLLKSATDPLLHEHIVNQLSSTRKRLVDIYFAPTLTVTQRALRRMRLARALNFYLDKAARHALGEGEYVRLSAAVDKLLRTETEIGEDALSERGYIFCPEYYRQPERVGIEDDPTIYLFGASELPDAMVPAPAPAQFMAQPSEDARGTERGDAAPFEPPADEPSKEEETVLSEGGEGDISNAASMGGVLPAAAEPTPLTAADVNPPVEVGGREGVASEPVLERQTGAATPVIPVGGEVELLLGHSVPSDNPQRWSLSIKGNPHLMIVGLPGMGKTTIIINLCFQLLRGGVSPIVFSYHDDLERRLAERSESLRFVDVNNGIGFNPMRVVSAHSHAWLDNVGKLRDIFAAIFPDFGEIQLNEIREAIKQSYVERGYGDSRTVEPTTPEFSRFFEILKGKPKPNPGVLARLTELDDYGFFNRAGTDASLLDARVPTVIRLHATQNEALQSALASFVLLNIYQSMQLRGEQSQLTHAVVFDEAHRASQLKLLPTMAKECRKFGISMIVASQEAKDFDGSLFSAVANYLVLRVTEADAKTLAKNLPNSADAASVSARLKNLAKYTGYLSVEGRRALIIKLLGDAGDV
jgi:DNA phosphorothioation-dependent restriction protein DptH